MKKKILALFIFSALLLLNSCSKDEEAPVADQVTYTANVKPLLTTSCSPCHVTGTYPKWDNYATTKSEISDIISRVQLEPTAPGFMPQGRSKLTAENITLLKKWVADGLLE